MNNVYSMFHRQASDHVKPFMRHSTLLMLLLLVSVCSQQARSQSIQFSIPNVTVHRGDTLLIPVNVNAIAQLDSVFSGQFTFSYNSGVMKVYGIERTGTVSENANSVFFNSTTKQLAFAHNVPLTGNGVFVYLKTSVNTSPSPLTTALGFASASLNEGVPAESTINGSVRVLNLTLVPQSPPSTLVVGDSLQFSISGDQQAPLSWSTSDTGVAKIDSSGKLHAVGVGQAKVFVHDNQGLGDSSVLFPVFSATLKSLTVKIRDTSYTQQLQFNVPVYISDVTSLGIVSAQFTVTFNSNILQATDVVAAGSMSESWSSPTSHITSGRIDVALAGSTELTGAGILAYIRFRVIPNASYSTSVGFSNVLFNETINANTVAGTFYPITAPTVVISPNTAVMTMGDTLRFNVTSGGTPPYSWSSSTPAVATINQSTGTLTAIARGTTTVSVTDSFGFTATSGSIKVNNVRASLPETSLDMRDSLDAAISIDNLTELNVLSYEIQITYNALAVKVQDIISNGTISNDFSVSFKDTMGTLHIAGAGSTPLSGAGTLLRIRFKPADSAIAGTRTPLTFTTFVFNEPGLTTPTVTTFNGGITLTGQPIFSATPINVQFGTILVGTQMMDSITVTNTGTADLHIASAASDNTEFTVSPSNANVSPADSQKFYITFAPTSIGLKNADIIFNHDAISAHDTVRVDGTGGSPTFDISTAVVNFDTVLISISKTDSVTVTNSGDLPLDISSVTSDDSVFTVNPTSGTIPPSQSMTFYISFAPTSPGVRTANIVFTHNASNTYDTVSVNGIGKHLNHAPVADAQSDTTLEDSPLAITLTGSDVDNDSLTFQVTVQPSHGILSGDAPNLVYTPNLHFYGSDSLMFTVNDGQLTSDPAKVSITVSHVNHAPAAFNLSMPADNDTVRFTVNAFSWHASSDIDGESLMYTLYIRAFNGSIDTAISGISDTSIRVDLAAMLQVNSLYLWDVAVTDGFVAVNSSDTFHFHTGATITGIENGNDHVPNQFALLQNYPNPFNPSTNFKFQIVDLGFVSLKLYDVLGREIAVLVNENLFPGEYTIQWNAANVPSGMYYYRLTQGKSVSVKKMLLLK